MSDYTIRPIDGSFNTAMLGILKDSPIVTGRMAICFDRQPDIFNLARCKYDDYFYHGLFDHEILKGFGMVGYHQALVNGTPSEVYCCRDLYVLPEARGNGFITKSAEIHFRENQHRSPIGYGLVMRGNKAPVKFLGKRPENCSYFPLSRIINQLHVKTILLTLPVSLSSSYRIRRATADDIPVIVELLKKEHKERLFGHIYNEESFLFDLKRNPGQTIGDYFLAFDRRGRCCGVCSAWDTGMMKQIRVRAYGKAFLPARIAWKCLSLLFKLPSLPGPGNHFRDITIAGYAVKERNPAIMNALLRAVYTEYRRLGYHLMIWGSSADDPLLDAANGFMSQSVISNIVLFSTEDRWFKEGMIKNHLPYIDVSGI